MTTIITSLYSVYKSYTMNEDESPKKVKFLVQEMESRLNQLPSGKEKNKLNRRIKSIKAAGKVKDVNTRLAMTGIHIVKAASSFAAGPIGSATATYITHGIQEKIDNEQKSVIKKASIKAGSRRQKPNRKEKATNSAIHKAGTTAISGFAGQFIMGSSLVVNSINYGKSFIFG